MPPEQTTWEASPHTLAKIAILRNYLARYYRILGRSSRQTLLYIDGFAGPDEYTNEAHGSPTTALTEIAQAISELGNNWMAGSVHCVFIEQRQDRFEHLKMQVRKFPIHPKLHIHLYNSSFVEGLQNIKREVSSPFNSHDPLFVFIDPFGATGVPFEIIAEILVSPSSEVLINLDADGIARIFQAGESANATAILNEVFGDNSWHDVLHRHYSNSRLGEEVLALYKQKLRSLSGVKYVFPFEMCSQSGALNYYLVFASKHPRGLIKMKEAMKKIDQDGSYRFSDGSIDQAVVFRFDDLLEYAQRLHGQFAGQKALYAELLDYTLNETPFTNPSRLLADLEKQGLIAEVVYVGKRRKGDFAEEKTFSVTFNLPQQEVQHGFQF